MNFFFLCTYYTVLYLNLIINKLFAMQLSMRYQAILQCVVNIMTVGEYQVL